MAAYVQREEEENERAEGKRRRRKASMAGSRLDQRRPRLEIQFTHSDWSDACQIGPIANSSSLLSYHIRLQHHVYWCSEGFDASYSAVKA